MGFAERILSRAAPPASGRKSWNEPPFWAYDNLRLPFMAGTLPDRERIENDFEGYIQGAYKTSGIVFACVRARQSLFSQARFQWHEFRNGRPGNLFGSPELSLLEKPWGNGTTVDLLARMEADVSGAGNFYATTADDAGNLGRAATGPGRRIARLRPDWVTLVIDSKSGDPFAVDAHIVAFLYQPRPMGQPAAGRASVTLLPDEVCHFAPYPDPVAHWRGMSWLTPVIREIAADKATTLHKSRFFENGATLQTVIKFDKDVSREAFDDFVAKFRQSHEGAENAYKTLALSPGADVTVVGANMQQMDFASVQNNGEVRIATAAGVPPVILGVSESLRGSSLNAGNFGAAKRLFVETTLENLWLSAAPSLQTLLTAPTGRALLRHDVRDVPFVREDAKDAADIQQINAITMRQLTDAGFVPESIITAMLAGDWSLLVHSGLFSVQLQAPGTVTPPPTPPAPGA